jgi:hypothetical protein
MPLGLNKSSSEENKEKNSKMFMNIINQSVNKPVREFKPQSKTDIDSDNK